MFSQHTVYALTSMYVLRLWSCPFILKTLKYEQSLMLQFYSYLSFLIKINQCVTVLSRCKYFTTFFGFCIEIHLKNAMYSLPSSFSCSINVLLISLDILVLYLSRWLFVLRYITALWSVILIIFCFNNN